ncbi:Glycoside hydrolase family 81 protein [Mycena venus]|uniref:Glycoside hydrolase family 81 protein n=1 Tax=Mycena venus TaxID=2733690 RepID=A0A8H6XMV0_9AGAR|nr:Glycoside hydrolase family 81 protein [Mycena venus]
MLFTVLASVLFANLGLVRAVDDRLPYWIPAGDTIATFTADFDNACATWPPAIAAGNLTFLFSLVEPGNFQGKNADTEALIACEWTDGVSTIPTTFTTEIAAYLGATPGPETGGVRR